MVHIHDMYVRCKGRPPSNHSGSLSCIPESEFQANQLVSTLRDKEATRGLGGL
ncbi:hypothetical protein BJX66DRAFT_289402, partial [Aspergillus keveii]